MAAFHGMTRDQLIEELETQAGSLQWALAMIVGSRDAVFISDENSHFVQVNSAAADLTGYSHDELLGMQIPDLHEEMDLGAFRTYHAQIMSGQDALTEAEIRRKDGIKVPVEFNNRRIEVRGVPHMHTTARDITQRKRADEALRQSEGRLRDIIQATQAGYFFIDREGIFREVNQAWLDMHGFSSAEEIIGQHFSIAQTEENARDAEGHVQRALKGEVFPAGQFSRKRRDGSIGYHEFTIRPVSQENEVMGVEGFLIDTTEARGAQEEMRKLQSLLLTGERLARMGSYDIGFKGGVVWSEETFRLFGRDPELGPPDVEEYMALVHAEDRDVLMRAFLDSMKGEIFDQEYRVQPAEGRLIHVHSRGIPLPEDSDQPDRLLGMIQDITGRKVIEEELREAASALESSQGELRKLTEHVQASREAERKKLARALHDELGECLSLLRIDLGELRRLGEEDVPEKEDTWTEVVELTDKALATLRMYWTELRTPVLDMLGPGSAIRSHAEELEEKTDLNFRIDVTEEKLTLTPDVGLNLFRIAQEALDNVLLHAEAENVAVSLKVEQGIVRLEISDDGKGIGRDEAEAGVALGIMEMKERARAIGAELSLANRLTGGTAVRLVLEPTIGGF